jgi:protease-4
MLRTIYLTAAVITAVITIHTGLFAENPFTLPNEITSVSSSMSPFAQIINPVFNDLDSAADLAYRYTKYEDMDSGNHYLTSKVLGFSLSYIWYDHLYDSASESAYKADANFFNISKGFFINNFFGWGIGWSYASSPVAGLDDYSSWQMGFILRPDSWISLGYALNDLSGEMGGSSLRYSETYSLSLRPMTDRLTLSVDAVRTQGRSYRDMTYLYGVDLRIFSDISMFVKADSTKSFIYGASMPIFAREPKGGMSSSMLFDYSSNYGSGRGFYSFGITLPEHDYKDGISLTSGNYLHLKIGDALRENEINMFMRGRNIVFLDLLRAVKNAGEDSTLEGIALEIDAVNLGFAQTQELRAEIIKAGRSGKKIIAVMKGTGNKEYYLATAAEKIYFAPNSTFYLPGLSAEVYYFRGFLDKVGVKFETVKRGRYKSAMEPFTETGMTKEHRANLTSLITDLNNQFADDIALSRNISRSDFDNILNTGPMTPEEAMEKGLIDDIKYPDEVYSARPGPSVLVSLERYINEKKVNFKWGMAPDIAVIYVSGSIVRGKSIGSKYVESMGDETYRSVIHRAFTDRAIRAVVIRVDSGGGSATASDFMWRHLVDYKKKYDKPVVISFGNIAASGGYYISCTGDRIFSSRGTVTGSIGVIFGKVSAKELYEKLGINKEVIKMSEFADIFSESRQMTEKEKAMVQKDIDFVYDRFTGKVIEGRGIQASDIPDTAEGRVFTGNQAMEKKLIDEHGGLLAAIEYAASLSGSGAGYNIVSLPDETSYLMDMLGTAELEALSSILRPLVNQAGILSMGEERTLYIQPWRVDIK